MGQSPSLAISSTTTVNTPLLLPPPLPTIDVDYTDSIPDECLAYIFQFLSAGDRKHCSSVCRRWYVVDGRNRQRLSLKAEKDFVSHIPPIFTRFDSVTKLSLRCDRKSISLNDDAFVMISERCKNLQRLKLRGCRELTDNGMAMFGKNCSKSLKKLSCGSCCFGVKGINEMLNYCTALEELSVKRIRGVHVGSDNIGVVGSSLKSICLKELVNGEAFQPLVVNAKKLKTLKVIRCAGDWDKVFDAINDNGNVGFVEVHLERIELSDVGLRAISKWVDLEVFHIMKTPDCSDSGLVCVAENCWKLRKLHVDGWRTYRIGDEGLVAVAKHCVNLQELVLIGVNVTHLSLRVIADSCKKLDRLALCGSATIRDQEIACIAEKCVALKKFCIKGCAISDTAIEALAWGCPNLIKIKVKKCRGVSSEVVDWLREKKTSLLVNFDAIDNEFVDATSLGDGGGDESGSEFPAINGQAIVVDGSSSSSRNSNGRLALFMAKIGVFASRNLVACAFSR